MGLDSAKVLRLSTCVRELIIGSTVLELFLLTFNRKVTTYILLLFHFIPNLYIIASFTKPYPTFHNKRRLKTTMEGSSQRPSQESELNSRLNALRSQDLEPPPRVDPFATPQGSGQNTAPGSRFPSSVALHHAAAPPVYFNSRRVRKGEQERPWLEQTDLREKWVWIIPVIGILIGLGLTALQVWAGLQRISKHSYCQILDEDWSGGFNEQIWTREVEVGGFG